MNRDEFLKMLAALAHDLSEEAEDEPTPELDFHAIGKSLVAATGGVPVGTTITIHKAAHGTSILFELEVD